MTASLSFFAPQALLQLPVLLGLGVGLLRLRLLRPLLLRPPLLLRRPL